MYSTTEVKTHYLNMSLREMIETLMYLEKQIKKRDKEVKELVHENSVLEVKLAIANEKLA